MNQEEKALRYNIRHLIRHVKNKKVNEEKKFQVLLNKLLEQELKAMLKEASSPDIDPAPNRSTGINVLEELLKKIIPVLETDFKSLTTNEDQRDSFRAHITSAVVRTLTPAKVNNQASPDANDGELNEDDIEEDVTIKIGDDETSDLDSDKFIDIRTDAEKSAEEEEEAPDEREDWGADVEGDETGRNMAYQCFKKIENNIIDSYELLADPDDQELFFDYLITNVKMYFDKFEEELTPSIDEPTNRAYDQATQKNSMGDNAEPADDFDLEV
jgi:hypothetical protein